MTYKFAPRFVIFSIALSILNGINGTVVVVFTKIFYEYIEKQVSFFRAVMLIVGMIIYIILYKCISNWYAHVFRPVQTQKLHCEMHHLLFEKVQKVDLAAYDNSDFYTEMIWSLQECDSRATGLLDSICGVFGKIISTISTVTVIASTNIVLAGLAVICCAISFVLGRVSTLLNYNLDKKKSPLYKKCIYIERIFSTPDYAKELRITPVSKIFFKQYSDNLQNIKNTEICFGRKALKCSIPITIITNATEPLVYIILLYQLLITRGVSLAGFAVSFSAFWSLWSFLEDIADIMIQFPAHGQYIARLKNFMDYKSNIKNGTKRLNEFKTMELKNVSFSYPDGTSILHNMNITIHKGERIAFVGHNGAGKTTLLKLMLHLYEPSEGEIFINSNNISDYSEESIRNNFSVAFQDFNIYAATIGENVLAGPVTEENFEDIEKLLQKNLFDLSIVKNMNTQLTKEFDDCGINLSGGEAQKVAISRALAKRHNILVLDEPAASLDPEAEYTLNRNIKNYSRDKTIIFISHRLSTTRFADKIYVLENGCVVESGSHEQLMCLQGKYAKMFLTQASKYKKEIKK